MTHGAFGRENWGKIIDTEIQETDVKIKQLQSPQSKSEPAAFVQWYDQLYHNGFEGAYDTFEKAILEYMDLVSDKYVQLITKTAGDMGARAKLIKRKAQDGAYSPEVQQIIDLNKEGLLLALPGYQNLIEEHIKNRLVTDGQYKIRKSGGGGKLFFKPGEHLQLQDGEVGVSIENSPVYRSIVKRIEKDRPAFKNLKPEFRLEAINNWLAKNKFEVMIGRSPVNKPTAVRKRRVKMLVGGHHADAIFLRMDDVVDMEGDFDGDTLTLDIPSAKFLKAQDIFYSESLDNRKVDIIVEKVDKKISNKTSASFADTASETEGMIIGHGVIGQVANAKNILYGMNLKDASISFEKKTKDGKKKTIVIRAKKIDDSGKVDYLRINGVPQNMSVEAELSNLIQVAVDDSKLGLWSQILGRDQITDFLNSRIFDIEVNGVPLVMTPEAAVEYRRELKAVKQAFGVARSIINSREFNLTQHIEASQDILFASLSKANMDRVMFGKIFDSMKEQRSPISPESVIVETNGRLTISEHILRKFADTIDIHVSEQPNDFYDMYENPYKKTTEYSSFLHHSSIDVIDGEVANGEWFDRAEFSDIEFLPKDMTNDIQQVYDEALKHGGRMLARYNYLRRMATSGKPIEVGGKERKITIADSDDIIVQEYHEYFNSLPEKHQMGITITMLARAPMADGKINKTNKAYLPLNLIHAPTLNAYADIFHKLENAKIFNEQYSKESKVVLNYRDKIIGRC